MATFPYLPPLAHGKQQRRLRKYLIGGELPTFVATILIEMSVYHDYNVYFASAN